MSKSLWRSFSGGEVTPEFFGQITDAKYQTGLALCRNLRVLPHGPVQNRAGTKFVRACKYTSRPVRLIPFEFSTTQTMVLEFGPLYVRFHTRGATLLDGGGLPYEIATPYQWDDLFGLRFVQSNDVLTLVHTNHAPRELRRYGALDWRLELIQFGTTLPAPGVPTAVATLGGSPGTLSFYAYAVTSVAANNVDESLVSVPAITPTAIGTLSAVSQANPAVLQLAGHGLKVGELVSISAAVGMPEINGYGYRVESTPTVNSFTLSQRGVPVDSTAFGVYAGGGNVYLSGVRNNLFDTGASNAITWPVVAGAQRYNVYRYSSGLWGYVGQAAGNTFTDDNITPDLARTPPEQSNPFAAAGDYPGAVTYFEQRRVFAGTINKPQSVWLTRSGTESNLSYSIPTRDADSIAFRVAARQSNTIRHLVPLNALLALTSAAEWRLSSAAGDPMTPTTVEPKQQSNVGAAEAAPVIVNNNVLYAAARGGHVREMAYQFQAGGYVTGDLSLRAPHLFDGLEIHDLAFAKSPHPIVWAVSSDGQLLGLTYVPEQQIGAWHRHDTAGGAFESCCVVAEGAEDVLYVTVRRVIQGEIRRYVERMVPRVFATPADAYFVDCGASYEGLPVATIGGLDWLEGETVSILADGAVLAPRMVVGGAVTLDVAASRVHVGLAITADLQTLPLAIEAPAFGQGMKKNVSKVFIRVKDSSGMRSGPQFDMLVEAKTRTTEPYGAPPALQTRIVEVVNRAMWADDAQVCVRQSDPLPLTITALTLEFAPGG